MKPLKAVLNRKNRSVIEMSGKIITLHEAIATHVKDACSVVIGASLESMIPFAATYEIIRQGKKDLDIIAPISDISTDILMGAGVVGTMTGAWVGNVSEGLGHNYRRAAEKEIPHRIKIKDHSNFSLGMALMAGAYGIPYVPIKSLLGSSVTESNEEFQITNNPFSEEMEPVVLVAPLVPDVAILSVQRADKDGNAHYWGNTGLAQEAALAAKKVIIISEEIVDSSVILSDPNRVLFPGIKVNAVVHQSAAVHPSPMTGIWQRDNLFFKEYHQQSRTREGFLNWLKEWVLGPEDHPEYLEKLGQRITKLKINRKELAAPVNYAAV